MPHYLHGIDVTALREPAATKAVYNVISNDLAMQPVRAGEGVEVVSTPEKLFVLQTKIKAHGDDTGRNRRLVGADNQTLKYLRGGNGVRVRQDPTDGNGVVVSSTRPRSVVFLRMMHVLSVTREPPTTTSLLDHRVRVGGVGPVGTLLMSGLCVDGSATTATFQLPGLGTTGVTMAADAELGVDLCVHVVAASAASGQLSVDAKVFGSTLSGGKVSIQQAEADKPRWYSFDFDPQVDSLDVKECVDAIPRPCVTYTTDNAAPVLSLTFRNSCNVTLFVLSVQMTLYDTESTTPA